MSHPAIALSPDLLVTPTGRRSAVAILQGRGMSRSAARDAVKRLTVAATGERLARRHSLGIARTIPAWMGENPNDGKRHVARMCPTDADIARQVRQAREESPDVVTREHRILKSGRMSKRQTHYVRQTLADWQYDNR